MRSENNLSYGIKNDYGSTIKVLSRDMQPLLPCFGYVTKYAPLGSNMLQMSMRLVTLYDPGAL